MPSSDFHDPEKRRRWQEMVRSLYPDMEPGAARLMEEMRLVAHALGQLGESSLARSGLSYAQYRVLMSLFAAEHIEGRDELNPSEISDKQGTSRNTISALIRSLEGEGLVERRLDANDRRRFNISLTPTGRDLVRQHTSEHMMAISRCFGALDEGEQEALSHLLIKLGRATAACRSMVEQE